MSLRLTIDETIEQWFENNKEEIWTMQNTVGEQWPVEPALIDVHISDLGKILERANELYAECVTLHHLAMKHKLPDRKEYRTDLDREIVMKANTVTERRFRDVLEGLTNAINQQVNNGRKLREAYVKEGTSSHRDKV